jgi:hypothetical protein
MYSMRSLANCVRMLAVCFFAGALSTQPVSALTITLSDMSSDGTPAGTLDATFDFSIIGGSQLEIVLSNNTTVPDEFNINQIWWNASANVTSLSLLSATHSVNGDVFAAWNPVETNTMVDGFGTFDYGLTDGIGGGNLEIAQPGSTITFLLDITGSCATAFNCNALDDFLSQVSELDKSVAAKFVNGPDDPEAPGNEDSAFGASGAIPEPGTFVLTALGLIGLAAARRAPSQSGL